MGKKLLFTYVQYGIYILFLLGLIILNTGLSDDISGNNIILNGSVFAFAIIIALVMLLTSLSVRIISKRLGNTGRRIAYGIILTCLIIAVSAIRIYYVVNYTSLFSNEEYPLYIDILCCALAVLRLAFVYLIALLTAGKQAGLAALFIEGFYYNEVIDAFVPDYRNVSTVIILLIVLLYCLFYRSCVRNEVYPEKRVLITTALLCIICISVCLLIYYEYSLVLLILVTFCLVINMLFIKWKESLILIIGIPILCSLACCLVAVSGYANQRLLDNELQYRIDRADEYINDFSKSVSYIEDTINHNLNYESGYQYEIALPDNTVITINTNQINILLLMYLSLPASVYMLFRKKTALAMYMLYSVLAYLWTGNPVICCIFTISVFYQALCEPRKTLAEAVDAIIENDEDVYTEEAAVVSAVSEPYIADDSESTEIEDNNTSIKDNNTDVTEQTVIINETEEISNLDKFIIPEPEIAITEELNDAIEQTEEDSEEKNSISSADDFSEKNDIASNPYNEDIISKLPVPRPIVNNDNDKKNVIIKNGSSFANNFDKDKWNNRKKRKRRS